MNCEQCVRCCKLGGERIRVLAADEAPVETTAPEAPDTVTPTVAAEQETLLLRRVAQRVEILSGAGEQFLRLVFEEIHQLTVSSTLTPAPGV